MEENPTQKCGRRGKTKKEKGILDEVNGCIDA